MIETIVNLRHKNLLLYVIKVTVESVCVVDDAPHIRFSFCLQFCSLYTQPNTLSRHKDKKIVDFYTFIVQFCTVLP